ncbi:UDP-glucose 4-epimerase GalE [Candidatus Beckwithbacteria bacterium CG23_combo_of_CG06-09_8_20_14_all_47_9]|uniref:UDP-glucose 4-epimerase n=1 Tax=Candidatus Beckwithbacteria bacterium CG23_combo_of_CG06-09_8_20_14_all_47_9 TaxID=1974498 RepID=A0A2H0B2G2_9BACT|nr:MAG: UDP-glucose 4-epimerase GalE [Candidatus Beckwithbacteria bacterium CG23_combo_of_CG06-09_8_20_14_all_47_9]
MKILVTGGRGYIGGITAALLQQNGHQTIIYDLKNGRDIKDTRRLEKTLKAEKIEAVLHFAAYIEMGESIINPQKYFDNNFLGSQSLLEAMVVAGINKIIFSSTAGVYGNPARIPIRETDRKLPENPYGQSKLMTEELLRFYDRIYGIKSISLRYFNAAGATLDAKMGEAHQPESHLIPNVIRAVLNNKEFILHGNNYPTQDSTCIRDYIQVLDLAQAHILALKALMTGRQTDVFNVGTGQGYSNLEVIKMIEKISGQPVKLTIGPRRPGDANELVADPAKIKQTLKWQPQYSDLATIIRTAWHWHKNQATI